MAVSQKPKRRKGLSALLTRSFLLISFVTLLISTALNMYFSVITQRAVINNEQALIAHSAASEVSTFITHKFMSLDQAANFNDLATQGDRRELILYKLLGSDPSVTEIYLLDKNGNIVSSASRLATSSIEVVQQYKPDILTTVLAGKNYISPVYFEADNSEPSVVLAVPAKDVFHDVQGELVAEVDLKFMLDLITQIKVGTNGLAYVVDRSGTLIAFRDLSRVLKHEDLSNLGEVSEFKNGEEHSVNQLYKGILGDYVVTRGEALGTPDWAVIVEIPITEAYAPLLQVLVFSILVIIMSMILAIVYAIYLSKGITEPIRRLIGTVDAIAAGDLAKRAQIASSDEIGHLADSFNTMADKLQGLYATQDRKIQDKTKELLEQVTEGERSKSAILNLLEDIEDEKHKVEHVVDIRTKELKAEKVRLLASINSLSFGFVLADAFDHIIVQNPALQKILGFEKQPESIHDLAQYFKMADSKIDIDITGTCKRCMELKEPVEFKEVPFGKKFVRVICTPIISETGPIGYIFLVEDITEAKVMERSRDEFFAVASHELRTPLTAIRGNADMILEMYADKIPDKDMKEMLTDINSSSVRLINIVNDFLEASRLEQGKIDIKSERFPADEIVQKVMRNLKEMITKKGLQLIYTPPPAPLPDVFADKARVEQILVNLVGNSAKFTKEGSITISMVQEGERIRYRVTDTGVGISEQNQALLFRKFQQAGEKMLARDVSQSTGLGLYICKLIINNMGGDIGLERSEFGKGSTFYFTIPIAKAA